MDRNIELKFPSINDFGYRQTSPPDISYNCIAWAAEDNGRWWWPTAQAYWPSGVERKLDVDSFIKAYGTIGYTPCDNGEFEESYDKIAIYVDENNHPTHAARQLHNGFWTSKLGRYKDIEHCSVHGVEGKEYGRVAVFLKRKKKCD